MSHQCLHSTNLHIVFMRTLPAKMLIFRNSLGSGRAVLLVARPIVDTGWDWLYGVNKQQTIILLNNSHCLIKHNNTTMVQHFINIFTIVLLQHKNFFLFVKANTYNKNVLYRYKTGTTNVILHDCHQMEREELELLYNVSDVLCINRLWHKAVAAKILTTGPYNRSE